jgi:hypothetical protein
MSRLAPAADTQHTFSVFMVASACSSGSGVTANGVAIDVIGTR